MNFVKNACDVIQEDLTDFFIRCGMLRSVDTEIGDYGGNRHLSISQKQVEEVIRYASRYPKPKSPVIHYITMNSVKKDSGGRWGERFQMPYGYGDRNGGKNQ